MVYYASLFVLLTGLMEQLLGYFVGLIASGYYRILIDMDWDAFVYYTIRSFALIVTMAFVKSVKQFMAYQTNIYLRRNLTLKLHEKYLARNSFCYLNVVDGVCDNPDQRITKDVDTYCTTFSTMAPMILISPFTIAYYTYRTIETAGWTAPVIILLFFIIATVINRFLIVYAGRKVFLKQREEGNLRHKHAMLRANAESAAYFGKAGSCFEENSLKSSVESLVGVMFRLSVARFYLDLASSFWQYSGSIVTYFIIAIPLFQNPVYYGSIKSSEIGELISKNSFVCMYLIFQLTSLIDLSDSLSEFVGTIHRIGQLIEFMDPKSKICDNLITAYENELTTPLLAPDFQDVSLNNIDSEISNIKNGTVLLTLKNITISTPPPRSKTLIRNLSLEVKKGCNILITGPSGCGKSSLFRTLSGIWPSAEGEFELMNSLNENSPNCMFLPQNPYVTVGSIADNIIFPIQREKLSVKEEDRILRVLQIAGLQERAMDINRNQTSAGNDAPTATLSDIMSPGEIQRFMFARLLYHSPVLAFLDEPTSSLDAAMEEKMFEACVAAGITLVTIAHRPERLTNFHTMILNLSQNDPSKWSFTSSTANF